MKSKVPRGYVLEAGELVVDKEDSAIVKWVYKMTLEYRENPPEPLIQYTMDKYEEDSKLDEVDKLTYEEAREKVSFDKVKEYVTVELNLRLEQYEDHKQEDTANELNRFLNNSLDESLITELEERFKAGHGIRSEIEAIYLASIGNKPPKEQGFKIGNSEPLILREQFEEAVEGMKKYKQDSNKEQGKGTIMTLE